MSARIEPAAAATNGRLRRGPTVPLVLELGTALASRAALDEAEEFRCLLAADLAVVLERLGIGGEPAVRIEPSASVRPLRVSVHGRIQPYPPLLARRAWFATAPPGLRGLAAGESDVPESAFPAAWLREYADSPAADPQLLLAFAARLVRAAVLQRPSCLLGREQTLRYAASNGIEPDAATAVLGPLLDLGVSVADSDVVRSVIEEGTTIGRTCEDTVEAAFTELRSHVVELRVHPESLGELLGEKVGAERFSVYSSRVDPALRQLFRDVEHMFFEQFGIMLPRLDWVATPSMPQRMLSIRSDAWSTLPVPLVMHGERLVLTGAESDELADDPARLTLHPTTGARCTIVDGAKEQFDKRGVTTWGPIDFVVLNVYAELAARPGRLLGMEEVEHQLARLRYQRAEPVGDDGRPADAVVEGAYRDLVYCVLSEYSIGDLTRVCRAFVEERLSIRNLPEILERLAHYETVPAPRDGAILFDDRLAEPAGATGMGSVAQSYYEFCRKNMKSYISARHAWAENVVVAYLLEPSVERRASKLASFRSRSRALELEAELLRDAVWAQIQIVGSAPRGQVVLVGADARAAVRSVLASELPDLPVLAHSELRPDVNVQPIARIGSA